MLPTDIAKAYDKITHLWQSKKFNRNNGINAHQRALKFITAHGNALDVGCGCTGRFIDLLQEQGLQPEGLDISQKMLSIAQKRHPKITFYHADICQWTPPKKYDFISAWDSIWHIPLDQQVTVISKLVESLSPEGVFIFSCGGTEKEGQETDSFMGPTVSYSTLGITGFLTLILNLQCSVKHFEFDQYPELHSYFIIQKNKQ
ncbi:class I SAM-dependent methyltransferase [Psychromonas sp. psych-6C06]|uniref:class I SAM-dependent methyltransferase n=1 Tax=Psychromonas sp. psych-6C06 TaxID=2058089 RepID=UPI000C31EC48|nr:class I SAM-dependent methyltransferase [Psychromonas sp. psych-6C06]PKF61045.1 class I SAM-dependent methyltransferase [Psychromonas sp. psych-6C06]